MADDFDAGVEDFLTTPAAPPPLPLAPRVKLSIGAAADAKPDYEAELRRAAQVTGVPLDSARSDPKGTAQRAAALSMDVDGLVNRAPATATFLAQPDNARIAHDDVSVLERVEGAIKGLGDLGKSSFWSGASGIIGAGQAVAPFARSIAATTLAPQAMFLNAIGLGPLTSGGLDDPKSEAGKVLTTLRKGSKVAADNYMPQTNNPWLAGVNSGVVSIFQNAPLTGAAILTRNPELALAGMGAITGGQAYGDAKDAGRSDATALRYAGTQGAIEVLTEKIPMHQLIGDVAKRTPFFKALVKNLALEMPGEQIATLTQDFDEWVTLHPDKPLSEFAADRGNAFISTAVATALGSTGNVAAAKLADVATVHDVKSAQAVQAQQQGVILDQLNEVSKASKLRGRDPQTFANFVAAATENGPVEHVYVDPRQIADVLAQGDATAMADKVAIMQSMPSLMPQMDQALQLGQDVRIPVSEFAAFAAGSDLAQSLIPHLKTDPAGMSLAESEAYLQTHGEDMKADVAKVVNEVEVQDEFQASAERVKASVTQQLTTANRFTPDVNEAYATLTTAFYSTMAERMGVTPEAFAAQHPVKIAAEGLTKGALAESVQQGSENGTVSGDAQANERDYQSSIAEPLVDGGSLSAEDLRNILVGQPLGSEGNSIGGEPSLLGVIGQVRTAAAVEPEVLDAIVAAAPVDVVDRLFGSKDAAEVAFHKHPMFEDGAPAYTELDVSEAVSAADPVALLVSEVAGAAAKSSGVTFGPRSENAVDSAAVDASSVDGLGQGARAPRGSYNPKNNLIVLLKGADLSTYLHEAGHFYLETLARVASETPDAPDVAGDMDTVLKFMGHGDKTAAEWLATPLNERRDGHELFARGFEAYLMEGKSPSQELSGVFRRFRAWLASVYKSLTQLKVELTDDVRAVFDRMLASQRQIEQHATLKGFSPLFASAEAAGMTPDEWTAYQRLGADATETATEQLERRSIRDMKWLSNARDRAVRQLQREAAVKRKAVKAEVTAEVMAEPVNRARQLLKFGLLDGNEVEGAGKLSISDLKAMYSDTPTELQDWRKLGYGKYGMLAEDGVHPDQVAELVGFSSGDELVEALLNAPPMADEIAGTTDRRMLERYGDLVDRDAIEAAADEALHNDARLRFVATEANALAKATGGRRLLAEAARGFAADIVGRQKIRDLRPSRYAAAETRAAVAAEKLARVGDLVGAATEKRNQVINGYATRAAYDAQEDVAKALRYFARFESPGARKSLDADYRDQIDALLERFDLRKGVSLKEIDKRKSLADWVERQRAQGLDPIIPDELLNEANRKHYRDMTVDELRGVVDSVRNIAHLGRLKNRLLTAKKNREFQAVVEGTAALIEANATGKARRAIESNRWVDRAESGVREFFAMHRKFASLIRQMAGFTDDNLMWDTLVRPMNAAGDAEALMREQSTVALHKILTPIIGQRLRAKVYIPEIGTSLSLEGRIMVAMNWGNDLNRARILDGDAWSEAQVAAILKTLTPEQLHVVQGVWDHIDSYWPQIAAKERRVSGVSPEKVEASPTIITALDGSLVELRGGYFPIKYDPARSTRAESDNIADLVKQSLQGAYTRATTRRGHTKARVDKVERPVRKDFGVIFQHVGEVAHDLAWHEYLIDANRLLGAPGIDGAIRDHYGREVLNTMRKALEDMALGDVPAANVFERGVNHVRSGATVAGLGYNLVTSALQPLGLTQSMVRIGPKWVAKGMSRWLRDAASMQNSVAWVNERSTFMRLRSKTMQREINEVRNQVSASLKPKAMTTVESSFFYFITKAQMIADMPTWLGQYEKAMANNEDEDTAVAQADQAVRDSQGAGQIGDLAQIQRGGPLMKLWTNFYSFFNVTYNQLAESAAETRLAGPKRLPLLAADVVLLLVVPSVLGTILKNAIRGDDWDDLPEKLAKDELGYVFGLMVGLRELGGIISSDGRTQAPAGLRFMQAVGELYAQAEQGEIDEAFLKSANNAAGILLHYPAGALQRLVLGIQAMAKGETKSPLAPIVGPPAKK